MKLFPCMGRGTWLTAQGDAEILLAVKKQEPNDKLGPGLAGRYSLLSFLCSGYPDATTYSLPIPRPDLTACVAKKPARSSFPGALASFWVPSFGFLGSVPNLLFRLPELVKHFFPFSFF